jgi:hypothetical protein
MGYAGPPPLAVLPKGHGVRALDALVVVGDMTEVRLPASSRGVLARGSGKYKETDT